jgi:cytidyltransferase-like protein
MNVLTLGTFDLFHTGHVNLLRACRSVAGEHGTVTVGLNTDGFVARYKGRPPVIAYQDRAAVVAACRHVDRVVPNDQASGSADQVILAVAPDVIVVGSDWHGRDYLGQLGIDQAFLDECLTRVVFVPYTDGISSTAIRGRLA